jgi:hypothetical protein
MAPSIQGPLSPRFGVLPVHADVEAGSKEDEMSARHEVHSKLHPTAEGAELATFLADRRSRILDEAGNALRRSHNRHYDAEGLYEARLGRLFDHVVDAIGQGDARLLLDYVGSVADQRFQAGFGLGEVQSAFNVLEEAMWRRISAELPAAGMGPALAGVTSVLGSAKDSFARAYVSQAARCHAQSLDLARLFVGTEGA